MPGARFRQLMCIDEPRVADFYQCFVRLLSGETCQLQRCDGVVGVRRDEERLVDFDYPLLNLGQFLVEVVAREDDPFESVHRGVGGWIT